MQFKARQNDHNEMETPRKRFYCREWVFQKLQHYLDHHQRSTASTSGPGRGSWTNGVLIVGAAGSGKTALCGEICWPSSTTASRARPQRSLNCHLLAYHFLRGHQDSTFTLSEFIRHLATQILNHSTESYRQRGCTASVSGRTQLADAYLAKLKSDVDIQAALRAANIDRQPDECFRRALLYPLLELDPPSTALFILIDSVDEDSTVSVTAAQQSLTSRTIAQLLANHQHLLPQWLHLVCTARKQSKWIARQFGAYRKLALDDVRKPYAVRDIQQYILARLDDEPNLRHLAVSRDTAQMLNHLHIKSNGCLLYLERVLDGVADGFIGIREIRDIPGTLNGLYLWLCQRLFQRRQFHRVRPLLNVLLAARSSTAPPLTETLLWRILAASNAKYAPEEEFQKRFQLLQRFFLVGGLRLFHTSFAEWLLDVKHCTQKYLCSVQQGHCAIAMYYTTVGCELDAGQMYDLAYHLGRIEANIHDSEVERLRTNAIVQKLTRKPMSTPLTSPVESHTLIVLWLAMAGCHLENCAPLISGEDNDAKHNGGVFSFDGGRTCDHHSVVQLLVEAGAVTVNVVAQMVNDEMEVAATAATPHAQASTPSDNSSTNENDDNDNEGALHVAARLGQAHVVAALLAAGTNPDQADADGWTPLRAASWGGHTEVVQLLVEHGCQLDSVDTENRTALRAAAWSGHEDIVRVLLERGADVNRTDYEGRTALIAAAYMGHTDIVEVLLATGAAPNHQDADGRTALSVAAMCAHSTARGGGVVTALLERGAHVDHADNDAMTPLLVAAFEGHHEICELLLENDADVDHADAAGRTPLWAAASMGHSQIVALLLFWGASIDGMDGDGRTVLSVAAAQGSVEVVRQLLDRGLDEQHRDNAGWTPLHYGTFEGHVDICECLLEAGARIDETDNDGKPPLLLAAHAGHTAVVASLVRKFGAPLNQRAHDGKTAVRIAALNNHFDVVRILVEAAPGNGGATVVDARDADGRTTLYVLALENRLTMARFLLENAGADVEARDLEGRSALHVAAWQGHADMVALLLHVGRARVDAVDAEQRTALHSASWQGHGRIVRILLEGGAAVDHACNQGATALAIAAQEGHEQCAAALLEYGADAHLADACGRSALRVAAKSGHRHVVRLLEQYVPAPQPQPHRKSTVSTTTTSKSTTTTTTGSSRSSSGHQRNIADETPQAHKEPVQQEQQLSFMQQLLQRRNTPTQRALSPLLSEPHSPLYASPPLSPVLQRNDALTLNIYQPVLRHQNNLSRVPDTHFARDTHMRIILGNNSHCNSNNTNHIDNSTSNGTSSQSGGGSATVTPPRPTTTSNFAAFFDKPIPELQQHLSIVSGEKISKPKRNGIVTNPALRLVANVKNGLDTAAANLRKSALSGATNNTNSSSTKTSSSFHWRKETPL